MCGILGCFGNFQISQNNFKKALNQINHRGPDTEGLFFNTNCYLGHKRLSIIDIQRGNQPMTSHCGRYTITFNGEVYNYQDLRKKIAPYYNFKTNSDTEVILAYYQKYKEKIVNHIEGMFAFAIYDKKQKIIFLARDPIGIKPLVYFFNDNKFIFASEIKSILPLLDKKLTINEESVYNFFCYKHIPAPNTIYKQIKKLPAGNYLIISLNKKKIQIEQTIYWRPEYTPNYNKKFDLKEIKNSILKTVESHLISDVPIGAFLSGGIDSSIIVWAMRELGLRPNTYTVGFANIKNDQDITYSRLLAKKLQTNHHELIVNINNYRQDAEQVIKHFDEPFADAAIISNYYVSREVSHNIKAALSGDGGDELFFGYPIYQKIAQQAKWRQLFLQKKQEWKLEKYFAYKQLTIQKLINTTNHQKRLKLDNNYNDSRLQMRMFDLNYTLPEYYLHKTDITSMMNSLEIRTPFLYRPFIENILTIPLESHYKKNIGKNVLMEAMKNILPNEILLRPKQGFSRPTHLLLTDNNIKFIQSQLKNIPFLNYNYLSNLIKTENKIKKNQSLVWRLLVFSWWFNYNKKYITL